jgi:predicted Zn-dependent protease
MALSFVVSTAPAAQAQSSQDIGVQMEREYGVVSDATSEGRRANNLLDSSVTRIVRAFNADKRYRNFQLRGSKVLGGRSDKHDKVINAFALPDGRIYVTLGLIRALDSSRMPEDELAFVVGHEVTHVAERHSVSQAKKSLPINIAAILLGAATRSSTLGGLAGLGAAAYGASFSRKDEYRADKGGLLAMNKAGYDLDAGIAMLKRLQAAGGKSSGPSWFSSHPPTGNRIDKTREMIADIRAGREPDADD